MLLLLQQLLLFPDFGPSMQSLHTLLSGLETYYQC